MNLKFSRLHVSNFLSFGEAEVVLDRGGFTLVQGVNLNPKDGAQSNGSGKSALWEALSWVLTGETIRGVKNIVNIHSDEGAFVEVTFSVDGREFTILRSKDHKKYKTNLKLYVDGQDKSGKGLKDTQVLLQEYLPNITPQLLGSVIILGQGLPQRFTSNSPAGRKELLEKLSQSDFMMEDLRARVTARLSQVKASGDEVERTLISIKASKEEKRRQQDRYQQQLASLPDIVSLQQACEEAESQSILATDRQASLLLRWKELQQQVSDTSERLNALKSERGTRERVLLSEHYQASQGLHQERDGLRASVDSLRRQLRRLKDTPEVCPTCGQKLPNVQDLPLSATEAELKQMELALAEAEEKVQRFDQEAETQRRHALWELDRTISLEEEKLSELQAKGRTAFQAYQEHTMQMTQYTSKATQLRTQLDNHQQLQTSLSASLNLLAKELEELGAAELYNIEKKTLLEKQLGAVTRIHTLLIKDFRGVLLSNVVDYIDRRAKEYAVKIFGISDIAFAQEGNLLNVSYGGKVYETLSGGEKQRVDIIVQLSLRALLCQYADFSANILVLDELFDGLDSLGCERVLNAVSSELEDVESIYIITHHSDIDLPIDHTITITKDAFGVSRLAQ